MHYFIFRTVEGVTMDARFPLIIRQHNAGRVMERVMINKVVSIRAYKTLKECQKLFASYQDRITKMDKIDLLVELERYKKEASNYPSHLLTLVKGEILLKTVHSRSLSDELKGFAAQEQSRLQRELSKRLGTSPYEQ